MIVIQQGRIGGGLGVQSSPSILLYFTMWYDF